MLFEIVETSKLLISLEKNHYFYQIAVFTLHAKMHRKSDETYIEFEVKIQENYGKNRFPKRWIFLLHFAIAFGRGWEGFGNGFGRVLEALSVSWVTF